MRKEEQISNEKINEIYAKEFPESMTWKEVFEKMNIMQNHPYFQELCSKYCDNLVSILTDNYIKYDFDVTETEPCRWLMKCVEKLDQNYNFLWAFYYFLKKKFSKCKEKIHNMFMDWNEEEIVLGEADITYAFIIPFKNAFDGFWSFIAEEVKQVKTEEGIVDFCNLIGDFYFCNSDDDMLTDFYTEAFRVSFTE